MSTDSEDGNNPNRMEKIDVRVPEHILENIEKEYKRRGYASRSEAIRDALRDWLNPPATLSDKMLDELQKSRTQRERGETVSAAEARERLGLNSKDE